MGCCDVQFADCYVDTRNGCVQAFLGRVKSVRDLGELCELVCIGNVEIRDFSKHEKSDQYDPGSFLRRSDLFTKCNNSGRQTHNGNVDADRGIVFGLEQIAGNEKGRQARNPNDERGTGVHRVHLHGVQGIRPWKPTLSLSFLKTIFMGGAGGPSFAFL